MPAWFRTTYGRSAASTWSRGYHSASCAPSASDGKPACTDCTTIAVEAAIAAATGRRRVYAWEGWSPTIG